MSETTTTAETEPSGPLHHTPWYRKRGVVVPMLLAAVAAFALVQKGTQRYRFRTDVAPDGGTNWDWEYAWSLLPDLLNALSVTAMATVIGFAVAAVLGLVLALGRRSRLAVVRWPVALFIEFVRSTPLLVQLYFLYFALPEFDIVVSPNQALIFGLGVHYATYCSEGYRAGINSVPVGQWEASTALNLGSRTKWSRVILPQAVPNVLPALGNYLVAGFKDAPLGFAIQVTGLMGFATSVAGDFRPVEAYLMIGAGFLAVSLPAAWLVRRLERRISYERV
ncbi:MAG: ectoine/hydroxyectoine ABC transporter permease subunit EhuD [Acidimicrobiales bacterium]|nr:ectoine/hydroxyectoine ABC transporter permease subunit EhuD [Acidimicrobiales bacterium]